MLIVLVASIGHRHRRDGSDVLHRMVRRTEGGTGADDVIGDAEGAEAGVLGATRLLAPVGRTGCRIALDAEAERPGHVDAPLIDRRRVPVPTVPPQSFEEIGGQASADMGN
jgi:hypothetical protein